MKARRRVVSRDVFHSLTLDPEPWLSCDECFDRIDEYVERLLVRPDHTDTAMATHLRACTACAEEAESLLELIRPAR
jgi:hypothetical protein